MTAAPACERERCRPHRPRVGPDARPGHVRGADRSPADHPRHHARPAVRAGQPDAVHPLTARRSTRRTRAGRIPHQPPLHALGWLSRGCPAVRAVAALPSDSAGSWPAWSTGARPAGAGRVEFDVLDDPERPGRGDPRRLRRPARTAARRHPRNAIVACWDRFEEHAERAGLARRPWETSSEFTLRLLDLVSADRGAVRPGSSGSTARRGSPGTRSARPRRPPRSRRWRPSTPHSVSGHDDDRSAPLAGAGGLHPARRPRLVAVSRIEHTSPLLLPMVLLVAAVVAIAALVTDSGGADPADWKVRGPHPERLLGPGRRAGRQRPPAREPPERPPASIRCSAVGWPISRRPAGPARPPARRPGRAGPARAHPERCPRRAAAAACAGRDRGVHPTDRGAVT